MEERELVYPLGPPDMEPQRIVTGEEVFDVGPRNLPAGFYPLPPPVELEPAIPAAIIESYLARIAVNPQGNVLVSAEYLAELIWVYRNAEDER